MATIYNSIIPNKIKIDYTSDGNYNNLHYDSNYLNINTWYFGIDVNRPYGPSSGTGWYQGIESRTIDDGIYTIYYTGTTIGNTGNANDKYRCIQVDQQGVIDFVDPFFTGTPTFEDALYWFKNIISKPQGGNGFSVCVNMDYPNIPTSGLTFALDAGHVASYPWINSTWYDFTQSSMSGFSGNSAIISNFNTGQYYFDFTSYQQTFTNTTYNRSLGNTFTLIFWAKPTYVGEGKIQLLFSCAPTISSTLYNQSVGFYNSGGKIYFYYTITNSAGTIQTRIGTATIDNIRWHQFTYVFAPDVSAGKCNISFYIDGTLSETNQETFTPASWSPVLPNFAIGQRYDTSDVNRNYVGGLQVFLAYDRVLSNTEIGDIYQNYFDTRALLQ